jgi:hypothetical protein
MPRTMKILFLSIGLIVLGSILFIEFEASAPKPRIEGGSLTKALDSLDERMKQKIHALNQTLMEKEGVKKPLFSGQSIRFEGQVFEANVTDAWDQLSKRQKELVLKVILENYRNSRQQRLKEYNEPTIIFVEDGRKVAVHTVLEDIIH